VTDLDPPQKPFPTMSPETRRFYMRVIGECMLNLHAVQAGYFDMLLCETEGAFTLGRWRAAVPEVMQKMRERQLRGY